MFKGSVKDYLKKVKNNEINVVEQIHAVIEECKKINEEFNYFNVISEELALNQAKKIQKDLEKGTEKKLLGLPLTVKDCICVKGIESTAGSKILSGYKPLFDATAVKSLVDEGAIIIGKTSQDEFGFGSYSVNTGIGFKVPRNPWDKERVTGGSSGGSAGITVKASFPLISLAESTGGSIANPASFCGCYSITPTYGLVSRYGLIDYANSLDKIGLMSKGFEESALALELIAGVDEMDCTSIESRKEDYLDELNKTLVVGLLSDFLGELKEDYKNLLEKKLKKLPVEIEFKDIKLPIAKKFSVAAYFVIAMSEASTNLAKYSGLRYGLQEDVRGLHFDDYFTRIRSNYFGLEAKRRIMLGTFVRSAGYRDAFYLKALKVRNKIIKEFKEIFSQVDLIASVAVPSIAPRFDEVNKLTALQHYLTDLFTTPANLVGLPHSTQKIGEFNRLPFSLMLIADYFQEKKLFALNKLIEGLK